MKDKQKFETIDLGGGRTAKRIPWELLNEPNLLDEPEKTKATTKEAEILDLVRELSNLFKDMDDKAGFTPETAKILDKINNKITKR